MNMVVLRTIYLPMLLALSTAAKSPAETMTSADQVIQQTLARSQKRASAAAQPGYRYTKVTVTEELDSDGNVKERQEKVFEARFEGGSTFLKLQKVNGQPVDTVEAKKQSDNEARFYRAMGQSKSGKGDRRESFLTPEIVARYDFRLVRQIAVNDRRSYEIAFQPKSPTAPQHGLMDKILDRVSGTLWIDSEEFEIARADIRLCSEVDILGGILGRLKKMAFTMARTRIGDGQWFNCSSTGDFEGRKLLSRIRFKTSSCSTDFHPLALN